MGLELSYLYFGSSLSTKLGNRRRDSRSSHRLFWGVLSLVAVAFAPRLARAEPVPGESAPAAPLVPAPRFELAAPDSAADALAKKQAKELEKQANELKKKGDCGAALPLWAEAYRAAGTDSALEASLACRESRGELVAAYDLAAQLLRSTPATAKTHAPREAKLADLGARTAVLHVTVSERHVELDLDGEPLGIRHGTEGVFRVLPGTHTLHASKQRFRAYASSVTLEAGKTSELTIELVAEPLPVTPSVDRQQVIDFCYLTPSSDPSRSSKQRLVLFKLAGREVADGPEGERDEKGNQLKGVEHHVLRDVAIHDHLRSTFLSTILMERFYTVEATVESPAALAHRPLLTDDEMIGAAGSDSFAAYSLACTDWVALPRLVHKEASWQKVKVTETKNGQKIDHYEWQLNLVWEIEADVYRHSPKGFEWRATVKGSNGSLFGAAMALSALAPQKNSGGVMPPLSKRPEPGCNPPLLPELKNLAETATDCSDALRGLAKGANRVLNGEVSVGVDVSASVDVHAEGAELGAEDASKRALEDAARAAGANRVRDTAAGAEKQLAQVPGADVAQGALEQAGAASGVGAAAIAVKAQFSAEEQSVLQALSGADPAAVDRLLALEASVQNAELMQLIKRAKHAFDSCKKPIGAIKGASEKLRTLSQQGPAALGIPAVVGLASCAGIELAPDLSVATAPGSEQRHSKFCENVRRDVALGDVAMRSIAVCDGRVAMEHATLMLQRDVKRLQGIRLFGTLLNLPGVSPREYGMSLGTAEGVHRGDLYVATSLLADGTSVEGGFGRVQSEGPGGALGIATPSRFKFRKGTADAGTKMEEHAQIGVPLGLRPLVKYYVFNGNLESKLAYGAALEGGYNASRFVSVGNEVWGRACVSVAAGTASELFWDLELGPEVVHYLGAGFAAYGGAGLDFQYATKKVDTAPGQTESVSGLNFGMLLTLGLGYAIGPDWDARLSLAYRQGGAATKLENDAKTLSVDAGSLSFAQAGLAASHTF